MQDVNGPHSVVPKIILSFTPASVRKSPIFFATGPPPVTWRPEHGL